MAKTIWQDRVERLQGAGLTREQVEVVFDIVDEGRGFHSQKTSDYARRIADELYDVEDPTAPLENTELGDHCANHGGVFEGVYTDSLDASEDDPEPICSEVDGGFAPWDQGCRFVKS